MKNKITVTIAISLLATALLFTACGKKPAAESPSASSSPAPEDVSPTPSADIKYPLVVKAGTSVTVDLNSDGKKEEVCYDLIDDTSDTSFSGKIPRLLINGIDCYNVASSNQEIYIDNPEPAYYCITDIDTLDNMLEIALMDYGPSSDYMTHFFRYDGTGLIYYGYMSGMIISSFTDKSDLTFNGDGTINSYMRLSVLQTWWAEAKWKLTDSGLEPVEQKLYYPVCPTEFGADPHTNVTLNIDIEVYEKNDFESAKSVLPSGTALTFIATDNKEWVLAKTSDGTECWIHLDCEYGQDVETPSGYVSSINTFSGLLIAD
ncbi:MAG: hypothetical protein QMB62_00185 [Oscillospiraceae bacterium]